MPKVVDHDAKREEILGGAFSLFARRGYGSVTMREIAAEAKVSTGTLYHYFADKETLFQRMFQHMSRRDVQRAMVDVTPEVPAEERLEMLFKFLAREEAYFHEILLMGFDYVRHATDKPSREFLSQTVAYYRDSITEQLALKGTGLDSLLFSFILGMLVQGIFDPHHAPVKQHIEFLRQIASNLEVLAPGPGADSRITHAE